MPDDKQHNGPVHKPADAPKPDAPKPADVPADVPGGAYIVGDVVKDANGNVRDDFKVGKDSDGLPKIVPAK